MRGQSAHDDGHRRRLPRPKHTQVNYCRFKKKIGFFYLFCNFRYLLKFGQVSHYLGYNAMQDFFPTMMMKPNDSCDDSFCRQRQREQRERAIRNPVVEVVKVEAAVVHEENDWGGGNILSRNKFESI